jgi:hypothetical protein
MPSQLYANSDVTFVCGRNFVYNGKSYVTGTDFDQEDAVSNIETLVRTRFIIPVVDDTGTKPRHFHREVRLRDDVLAKLGKAPQAASKPAKKAPKKTAKKAAAKKVAAKKTQPVVDVPHGGVSDG